MKKRATRSAKTDTKVVVGTRGKSQKKQPKKHEPKIAVVAVDPFRSTRGRTSPPIINIKRVGAVHCQWQGDPRSKTPCDAFFDSAQDLKKHLITKHKKASSKVCRWKGCTSKAFKEVHAFEVHLQEHVAHAPFSFSTDDDGKDDEDKLNDNEIDSDFLDSSDEEVLAKKKKKSGMEITVRNIRTEAIPVSLHDPQPESVCLSFYRFTCMWVVPFTIKNKTGSEVKTEVTCMRKFTVLEESMDHLRGHHLKKMKSQNLPLKCYWKECPANDKLFPSEEKFIEHLKVHVEERIITIKNGVRVEGPGKEFESLKTDGPVPLILETGEDSKMLLPELNEDEDEEKIEEEIEKALYPGEPPWIEFVFLALLRTAIKTSHAPCSILKHCTFCRFASWKSRVSSDEPETITPFEFTLIRDKYRSKDETANQFVRRLYNDIVRDEQKYHFTSTFKNTYWFMPVEDMFTCAKHHLNLTSFYSNSTDDCRICKRALLLLPRSSHLNLVVTMSLKEVNYPASLASIDQTYHLQAVVCRTKDCPEVLLRHDEKWFHITGDSLEFMPESEVVNHPRAEVVVYTLGSSRYNDAVDPQCEYTYESCASSIPKNFVEKHEKSDLRSAMKLFEKFKECTPDSIFDGEVDITSTFTNRHLKHAMSTSCMNTVLQALLQTSITSDNESACSLAETCSFCRIMAFIKKLLSNSEGKPIVPPAFIMKHVSPATFQSPDASIHSILTSLFSDEKTNHKSNSLRDRFVIRHQMTKCYCMMSREMISWKITPLRRNEYLPSIVSNCKVMCEQCNKMATLQPIQMPDNLIFTIEKNRDNPEASVYYPDEWASHGVRYRLASVIISGESPNKEPPHFVSYCRVFEKWYCYDDERVVFATSSDVFGSNSARVLVYVTEEITEDTLKTLLTVQRPVVH